ncbi:hypothetical protein HN014_04175 [Aquimarina sp. TRL1]|uniref:hypothetical protein n=1 Tax=Aquimarina sp. (strain TRL1) TaxID=2736252 RepID=UPI00158BA998|nr:hypothetical protein [Aquimarina sp. TRL1]QKX04135.1 hypothetical protein HN014_04175 [Aquimarina sp. TRL1]
MKNTLLVLGVGFLIGRHIYKNYDQKQAQRKETQIKRRLIETLEDLRLSKREVKSQSNYILRR